MEIVIGQSKLREYRITYQEEIPVTVGCRRCKEEMGLIVQVHDDKGDLVRERPEGVKVWPHDSSVISVYLCTNCGSMRAGWNQG